MYILWGGVCLHSVDYDTLAGDSGLRKRQSLFLYFGQYALRTFTHSHLARGWAASIRSMQGIDAIC